MQRETELTLKISLINGKAVASEVPKKINGEMAPLKTSWRKGTGQSAVSKVDYITKLKWKAKKEEIQKKGRISFLERQNKLDQQRLTAVSLEDQLFLFQDKRKRMFYKYNFELNCEDKRVIKDNLKRNFGGEMFSKPRKCLKKTDLRILDLIQPKNDPKTYFSEQQDPSMRLNLLAPRFKLGIQALQFLKIEQFRPKNSNSLKLSNNFAPFASVLKKRAEIKKMKKKMSFDIDFIKRFEPQQYMVLRQSLIARPKQVNIYQDIAFASFSQIDKKTLLFEKIMKEKKKYTGINPSDIAILKFKNQRKHFMLVQKDLLKVQKYYQKLETKKNDKKLINYCVKFYEKKQDKNNREIKDYTVRARKLNKEAISFWRKREKELNELKKRENKLEKDKQKKEEEKRENELQTKKLEFLVTQSEIYSQFMEKKLNRGSTMVRRQQKENLNIDKERNTNIIIDKEKAFERVKNIINDQRRVTEMYDENKLPVIIRKGRGAPKIKFDESMVIDPKEESKKNRITSEELKKHYKANPLDFSKVNISNGDSNLISCPNSFQGQLKEYQLDGLRWLDNLYEQGINGILADEMGLGKTIQAIALLGHLTEKKNNWGPFLIIAPNSTLFNWKNEIHRFCPSLKVVPYWGNLKHRKVIKKIFDQRSLGKKESRMHVIITSYSIAVIDTNAFQRVMWKYIILDEAQAIKNYSSQRWKIILSFKSRNKLLLSGTPVQNSMVELWALLHFIMPKMFDSLEQFKEWFSKDIEYGSKDKTYLNEIQLKRLHGILKPFMLRRVKKDVEKEIGKKIEYKILCEMTKRQKELYSSLKNKLSLNNFFHLIKNNQNLLNLVMQLRKVCNHPEIFERRQCLSSFVVTGREILLKNCQRSKGTLKTFYVNWISPISFLIPQQVYRECYGFYHPKQFGTQMPDLNIHNTNHVWDDVYKNKGRTNFSFYSLSGMSASDYSKSMTEDKIYTYLAILHSNRFYGRKNYINKLRSLLLEEEVSTENDRVSEMLKISNIWCFYGYKSDQIKIRAPKNLKKLKQNIQFNYKLVTCFLENALAVPVDFLCSDSDFMHKQHLIMHNPLTNYTLYGSNKSYPYFEWIKNCGVQKYMYSRVPRFRENMHFKGLLGDYIDTLFTTIIVPSFDTTTSDSAKLRYLDKLLLKLKKGGHRVLIFCQMTKMLNILEEYLLRRNYIFFRLDGNTHISDRDQMVQEFQNNSSIFAFILSTRAGGLGVTLTAADTVIFYDNDWNPTMDAQATDRAHRIGQTKDVSVYRLVTKNTIEVRILERAQHKKNIQETVYSGEAFSADKFNSKDIVNLLLDENELKEIQIHNKGIKAQLESKDRDIEMKIS